MVSLATESDRTLFFDFLPVELGTIRGMRTRVQIYTVPGQVFYDATRKMVLKGADAVVFVADSQEAMLDANLESLESLRRNLIANDLDPGLPMVFQYNKRDLPNAMPVAALNARLNPRNLPHFEAIAFKGVGVEDTLKGVTKLLFKALSDFYGTESAPKAPVPQESRPATAPRPACARSGSGSAAATARPQPSPASAPAPAAAKPPPHPHPRRNRPHRLRRRPRRPRRHRRPLQPLRPGPLHRHPRPRRPRSRRRPSPPPAPPAQPTAPAVPPSRPGCQTARPHPRPRRRQRRSRPPPLLPPRPARCRRHPPHAPPRRFASAKFQWRPPRAAPDARSATA